MRVPVLLAVCDFTLFDCALLCWAIRAVTICVNLVCSFAYCFIVFYFGVIGCGFICLLGACFVWCFFYCLRMLLLAVMLICSVWFVLLV